MYSLGLESLAPNTSIGNNHGKNTCLIDHKIFTFFTFMLVAKILMHNVVYNVWKITIITQIILTWTIHCFLIYIFLM
jgi:hypothetical protein